MEQKSSEQMTRFLPISLVCLTLSITPWYNFDSITLPKFTVLTGVGLASWYLVFNRRQILISKWVRTVLAIHLSFIVWLLLAFLLNGKPNLPELFGAYGRNTGLITYLSFVGILLLAFTMSNSNFNQKIMDAFFIAGCANLVYGLIQFHGYDPFKWDNPYSPIVGTLGNPNFLSSYLGMFGTLLFARVLKSQSADIVKNSVLLLLTAWLIVKTDSVQGIFVLGIGIFILIFLFLLKGLKSFIFAIPLLPLGFLATFLTIMGLVGIGPFASLATNGTVVFRQDYWIAGLRMAWNNPILGVGIDGYGDFYREYRTLEAATRRGPNFVTDASHNVFIDLFVSGGIPLLIIYCLIISLVFRAIYRIIRLTEEFDGITFGLIAIWIGHLAQSLISINQIGLAVWFWTISGVVLGQEKMLRSRIYGPKTEVSKTSLSPNIVKTFCLVFTGLVLALPALVKDHKYRMALESREVVRISEVAYQYPRNSFYFNRTMLLFKDNNFVSEIAPLARQSIADNPRNYWGWRLLAEYAPLNSKERMRAIKMTAELDPHNPENPK